MTHAALLPRRHVLAWGLAGGLGRAPAADDPAQRAEQFVGDLVAAQRLPGLALAVMRAGRLVFTRCWGNVRPGAPGAIDEDTRCCLVQARGGAPFAEAEQLAMLQGFPPRSRPGERFPYSNAGYNVLASLVGRVRDARAQLPAVNKAFYAGGCGSLQLSLRDLMRWDAGLGARTLAGTPLPPRFAATPRGCRSCGPAPCPWARDWARTAGRWPTAWAGPWLTTPRAGCGWGMAVSSPAFARPTCGTWAAPGRPPVRCRC